MSVKADLQEWKGVIIGLCLACVGVCAAMLFVAVVRHWYESDKQAERERMPVMECTRDGVVVYSGRVARVDAITPSSATFLAADAWKVTTIEGYCVALQPRCE